MVDDSWWLDLTLSVETFSKILKKVIKSHQKSLKVFKSHQKSSKVIKSLNSKKTSGHICVVKWEPWEEKKTDQSVEGLSSTHPKTSLLFINDSLFTHFYPNFSSRYLYVPFQSRNRLYNHCQSAKLSNWFLIFISFNIITLIILGF